MSRSNDRNEFWRYDGDPRAQTHKEWAQREWSKRKLAAKPQIPCDVGLFGDDHLQLDLVEMLQDPVEDDNG